MSRQRHWAIAGALLGGLIGLVAFAPAAWLAAGVARASAGQLLLADARGTLWSGNAVAVLSGGAGSQDAVALPGRLAWTLGLAGGGLELRASQACCLRGEPRLQLAGGVGRWSLRLLPADGSSSGVIGQWPAAWLAGLGTPWNTLQLDGELRLTTTGVLLQAQAGRWQLAGDAVLDLRQMASRLSTLPVLGSYRLQLAAAGAVPQLTLTTLEGALRLSGSGEWGAAGLRFRGEASAAAAAEAALANLLNIIGRRQGARSLIAIG
jgi:general secretion pathway protein N